MIEATMVMGSFKKIEKQTDVAALVSSIIKS